ncbi:hypothetical protein [Chryseobacterium viscerum]|uniref:hypothetical protein n=1 Tax=Chryseobacterium viscerum TaxID=1037377 RepID=UPI002221D33E|nr:hypothetical protein [Chryseobacterium viscerum]MCW1962903.1 hypothetical protein [Chryseobacterium viscerum]
MNIDIKNKIDILLKQKRIIQQLDNNFSLEISNLLDKNNFISIYEIKLGITNDNRIKNLYSKLIKSLEEYSGSNIFMVIIEYSSFQELCLINEEITDILCYWPKKK